MYKLVAFEVCLFFPKRGSLWGTNTWGQCCFMGSMMYGLMTVGAGFSPQSSPVLLEVVCGLPHTVTDYDHISWWRGKYTARYRSISVWPGEMGVPLQLSFIISICAPLWCLGDGQWPWASPIGPPFFILFTVSLHHLIFFEPLSPIFPTPSSLLILHSLQDLLFPLDEHRSWSFQQYNSEPVSLRNYLTIKYYLMLWTKALSSLKSLQESYFMDTVLQHFCSFKLKSVHVQVS